MPRNIISIYKLLLFFSTVMISKAKVQTIPDPLSARPFTHNYNKDMVWIYSKDILSLYMVWISIPRINLVCSKLYPILYQVSLQVNIDLYKILV